MVSPLRIASRIATIGVVIAAGYAGWIVYSRHADDLRAAQELAAKREAARQRDAKLIFGSGEVKIASYSIDRPSVRRGESATLCYGTVNATQVKLEPPVEPVKPSGYHCMEVAPRTTTTYTLTALNDKGDSKTASARLEVR